MKRIAKGVLSLDLFSKFHPEAQERTISGTIVTFISILCVIVFSIVEIYDYYKVDKINVLQVHTERDAKMDVNFRLIFYNLPCEALSMDVTDRTGADQLALPQVQKAPWQGKMDTAQKLDSIHFRDNMWANMLHLSHLRGLALPQRKCEPCYVTQNECCNNCYKLKLAYANAGQNPAAAETQPQCVREKEEGPEGCLMSGQISLNMAPGNFHIAVGAAHNDGNSQFHHHHWPEKQRILGFNTTHIINYLNFGTAVEGIINPLDGYTFVENGIGQQTYFIQVVPTEYINSKGIVTKTNQYSYTSHHTKVNLNEEHVQLPGVFFKFDISPIKILIQERAVPFSHFITRLCAVIGGVWVVLGLLHTSLTNLVELIIRII